MPRKSRAIAVARGQAETGLALLATLTAAAACALLLSVAPARAQDAADAPDGADIFTHTCAGCHGKTGGGGIGKKLACNDELADLGFALDRILNGKGGMPAFKKQFSDEQVAAVATHIRTSFGNDFGPATADDVATIRAGDTLAPADDDTSSSADAADDASSSAPASTETTCPAH